MADALRDTFFTECEELLGAMAEGLDAMADGVADGQTIHAVFRAVHSIKGAAGAFSFRDVVAFAHSFETVLDLIRSGRLLADPGVMQTLRRAGDVLSDLLDTARDGGTAIPQAAGPILDALEALCEGGDAAHAAEELDFVPLGLGPLTFLDAPEEKRYRLRFRPSPALFGNGHDPVHLFAALADLGQLEVECDTDNLPSLDRIDPEGSYLSWDLVLQTSGGEDRIREVFAFVEDLCGLDILPEDLPATLPFAQEESIPAPAAITPTPAVPPPAVEALAPAAARLTLRVDLDRVDRLVDSVGELIINQAVIAQKIADAGLPPSSGVQSDLDDYSLLAREIQEAVMAIRAQPVKSLFQRMARVAREASDATGKPIRFVTEGEASEVDRAVVEGLADPLTHMIRNAIDHGLESPEDRRAAGKPEAGLVRLSASHQSGNVLIEVRDDGRGLDPERIRAAALRKGLIAPNAALSDSEANNLLFMPGFSTASSVTNLSGRGDGLDVVRTAITALGGRIGIDSRLGEGTGFIISLPLTLAVLDGMIVSVAGQTMVLPTASVLETIRPTSADLSLVGRDCHLLSVRGACVPVIDVADLLGQGGPPLPPDEAILVMVQTEGAAPAALAVESISDQRQVVIKSLKGNYGPIPGVAAATILGDGKVALILDPDALVAMSALRRHGSAQPSTGLNHDAAA